MLRVFGLSGALTVERMENSQRARLMGTPAALKRAGACVCVARPLGASAKPAGGCESLALWQSMPRVGQTCRRDGRPEACWTRTAR